MVLSMVGVIISFPSYLLLYWLIVIVNQPIKSIFCFVVGVSTIAIVTVFSVFVIVFSLVL
jgi:hypothetical protein